jgi:hypothetical protein
MSQPDSERDDPFALVRDCSTDRDTPGDWGSPPAQSETVWLQEIIDPLEDDPRECWLALEALATIEPGVRRSIIGELTRHRSKPGVRTLLRLLGGMRDPRTRAEARTVLDQAREAPLEAVEDLVVEPRLPGSVNPVIVLPTDSFAAVAPLVETGTPIPGPSGRRIVRCAVTPVDGQGRGFIVVSVSQVDQRRTAAFWCDVVRGMLDVVGEVEPNSNEAGRLLDDIVHQASGESTCDVPELALGLLGGSLMLSGPKVPDLVRDWLDGTIGPGFRSSGLPGITPGLEAAIPDQELPRRADQVLEACPFWLDDSPLTFELAEEIHLREGRLTADPGRDTGAYRFLFEHLLIHRLERYGRMLLWMGWLWQCSGKTELARSAFALACQLSDEQYAVPSHPFTVALTTRSLEAAQARLRTAEDPRAAR